MGVSRAGLVHGLEVVDGLAEIDLKVAVVVAEIDLKLDGLEELLRVEGPLDAEARGLP